MKGLLLICMAGLLCICNVLAQPYQQRADSLNKLVEAAMSDTARSDLLGSIAIAYARMGKFDTAREFAGKALALARKQSYPYYEAQARYSLGNIYMLSFSMDSAIMQYDLIRSLLRHDKQTTSRALYLRSTINLAQAWFNKSFHEKGTTLLIEILPELEKGADKEAYAASLHNLSAAFITLRQYSKAYPYQLKDIELAEQANAGAGSKAESYLNAALLMYYMDSVSSLSNYLGKAERQLRLLGKDRLWTRFYSYEALSYLLQKPGKANEAVRRAFSNLTAFPDRETEYDAYEARKTVEAAQGNYKAALVSAQVIEKMATEDELPEYSLPALKDIATYANLAGNTEMAYIYLDKYTRFKDSIDKQQTAYKINELELRYQTAQKEHRIADLQAKSKIQKLLLWFLAALSLLSLLFFLYRSRQKKKLVRQQLQTLQQQRYVEVAQALIAGEERERGRLARDLHDGLGGMLAAIKLNLSQLISKKRQLEKGDLNQTIDRLGHSVNELRRISRNMMPESLLQSGLAVALKDLCDDALLPGLKISFKAFDLEENFSPHLKVMIYRIVQELVYNVLKHAGASKVMVQCSQSDKYFFITVEDNGRGFSPQNIPDSSQGLKNIQSRVDLLNGKMEIDSSDGGTNINIELYVGQ